MFGTAERPHLLHRARRLVHAVGDGARNAVIEVAGRRRREGAALAVVEQQDRAVGHDARIVGMPVPRRLAHRLEHLVRPVPGPALRRAQDPFQRAGRPVDLDHAILVADGDDEAVVSGVVGETVGMGQVGAVGHHAAKCPERGIESVGGPARIENAEKIVGVDHVAFGGEFDQHVGHQFAFSPAGPGVRQAEGVIVELAGGNGERRQISVRQPANRMMEIEGVDRDFIARRAGRRARRAPLSQRCPARVDLLDAAVRGYHQQRITGRALHIHDRRRRLPAPNRPALPVDGDQGFEAGTPLDGAGAPAEGENHVAGLAPLGRADPDLEGRKSRRERFQGRRHGDRLSGSRTVRQARRAG